MKKVSFIMLVCLLSMYLLAINIHTEDNSNKVTSKGNLSFSSINDPLTIDSSDLYKIKNMIKTLEDKYNVAILTALTQIGTNLPDTATFDEMINGISSSQDIPSENYITKAENLSNNCGAWVDGEYIVGNGQDVTDAYNKGYADGKASVNTNARIEYVYHVHTGSNGTGCYTGRRTCGARVINDSEDPDGNGGYIFTGNNYYCTGNPRHGYGENNPGSRCPAFIGWTLGCGKTTNTIEKAIIVYD